MNSKTFLTGLITLFLFSSELLFAQENEDQAEQIKKTLKDPLIPRMPERACWKVIRKEKVKPDQSDVAPKRPKTFSATIFKDGENYLVQYDKSLGGVDELWIYNGSAYTFGSKMESPAMVNPMYYPMSDFSGADFEDFVWVKAKHFLGIKDLKNKRVMMFKAPLTNRTLTGRERYGLSMLNEEITLKNSEIEDGQSTSPIITEKEFLKNYANDGDLIAALDFNTKRPLFTYSDSSTTTIKYLNKGKKIIPPPYLAEFLERNEKKVKERKASGARNYGN